MILLLIYVLPYAEEMYSSFINIYGALCLPSAFLGWCKRTLFWQLGFDKEP